MDAGSRARRFGDRMAIAAYVGGKGIFDQVLADFSVAYADKNERDFAVSRKLPLRDKSLCNVDYDLQQ
jgi:Uncharacterized protein conserved in bacteria (DUF2252)